jgi:Phosphotransferase system cellobiose-specific component IIC
MRNKLRKVQDRFVEYYQKVGSAPFPVSVRKGFATLIPVLFIGSFALVILNLPIPAYQNEMVKIFGKSFQNVMYEIRDGSFNILSILMVIFISNSFAVEYCAKKGIGIPPVFVTCVSVCSFSALTRFGKDGFNGSNLRGSGILIAIVATYFSSILFLKLSTPGYLKRKTTTSATDSTMKLALLAVLPATITITVFALAEEVFVGMFGFYNIQSFLSESAYQLISVIYTPLVSASMFTLLLHLFWLMGMQGNQIMEEVAQRIFVPALTENQTAITAGYAPVNIFTKPFFDTFVLMGGSGAVLCLVLAIFIVGKQKNLRKLTSLSVVPVLFNINELILFGIPIILNPIYIVPFLMVPLIFTSTTFFFMYCGFVPYTIHSVAFTTPIFFSGYGATGSFAGSFLQLFNLILGTLFYIPFIKFADKISRSASTTNLK